MKVGYRQTANTDSTSFFEGLAGGNSVHWDESVNAWLAFSYDTCSAVLENEELFNRADRFVPGGKEASGGWRHLAILSGEDHRRLHTMMLRIINPRRAESYRRNIIRPLADQLIDRFVDRGAAELVEEFADQLPPRVGCAIMGQEASEERVELIKNARAPIERWKDSMSEDPVVIAASKSGFDVFRNSLLAEIRKRRDEPTDDFISEVWQRGREVLEDWNEFDTFDACSGIYYGGETKYLLRNAIHGVLASPGLQERLLGQPEVYISRYVEETLRFTGVVHWQIRIAASDTELGGQQIGKGDHVYAMISPANRDETHFACPHGIDIDSDAPKDHLGFGRGPRYCPGAPIARVVVREGLLSLLEALPKLRLDQAAEPPRLGGWHVRTFTPLNAVFESRRAAV